LKAATAAGAAIRAAALSFPPNPPPNSQRNVDPYPTNCIVCEQKLKANSHLRRQRDSTQCRSVESRRCKLAVKISAQWTTLQCK